jgi:hypothetical protein
MRYVHATDEGKRRAVEAAVRRGNEEPATNLPQTPDDALDRGW